MAVTARWTLPRWMKRRSLPCAQACSVPAGAQFRVLATNNALDDDPAWEDVTAKVLAGINHLFENEAAEKVFAALPSSHQN